MTTAVGFALVATCAWGLWAVLATLATRTIEPGPATAISFGIATVVAGGYAAFWEDPEPVATPGITFAVLAGAALAVGSIGFYLGLARGNTGVVTAISALYFVVAAILGVVVFGESLSIGDVAGIALAAVAIWLLTK